MKGKHLSGSKKNQFIDLDINFQFDQNIYNLITRFYGLEVLGIHENNTITDKNKYTILKKDVESQSNIEKDSNFYLNFMNFKSQVNGNFSNVDLFTIKEYKETKTLLKRLTGKNIGIEILISDLKSLDNNTIGKWFYEMKYIYLLCKRYNHQFILSSGAKNPFELVSKKSLNIFLEELGIPTNQYWNSLNSWVDSKKRGTINDTN